MKRMQRHRVSPEKEAEVGRLYRSGLKMMECATATGLAYNTICNILKRTGVKTRPRQLWLRSPHHTGIVSDLKAGMKPAAIAAKRGIHVSTVRNNVLYAGEVYPTRSQSRRRYSRNDHAFAKLTDGSAYWLGFILTDGNISSTAHGADKDLVQVSLAEKDRGHLETLKAFLGYTGPVFSRKSTCKGRDYPSCGLCVISKPIVTDLLRYGITPRKSLTATVSPLLQNNVPFWRGVIDGDGCLRWSKRKRGCGRTLPILELCGTEAVCLAFAEFVKSRGIGGKGRCFWAGTAWRVTFAGRAAVAIANLLYSGDGPTLTRKKQLATSFKSF